MSWDQVLGGVDIVTARRIDRHRNEAKVAYEPHPDNSEFRWCGLCQVYEYAPKTRKVTILQILAVKKPGICLTSALAT